MSKTRNAGPRSPRILLLSGYDAGSHKRWREQLVASQPDFDWQVIALPPRYFRWRIRGNALSWLDAPELREPWDLIVATSMVDVAGLRAMHPAVGRVPVLLYMHENQFAYPDSGEQHASVDPQMVNLYSALSADRVVFNSEWNRRSFLEGIDRLLERLPDAVPQGVSRRVYEKSCVLPVPIADAHFVERHQGPSRSQLVNRSRPHLLWNHRWEYDKAPDRLLSILLALKDHGQAFRLSVVGEQFRRQPEAFESIRRMFGNCIEHWGFMADQAAYDQLLQSADIVMSTALHDFQGLSVLEAMASGCLALAPNRLAYPEYVPDEQRYPSLADRPEQEAAAAANVLVRLLQSQTSVASVEPWRLSHLQPRYRELLRETMASGRVC
ncbi:tRNA-queuosine alpha-mannosyltransferase domain-containing protein [Marinobacter fonticola]|uniref:tRNA-queuosine alpha-mannosyltransferase domain-containing protein n=1 Tax=Marinobacter fonticola TaxID=2603215 RepID=UPI0011E7AE85|nr:DUF3524 domain-containing protein [Marinobacter fonticola]